MIGAGCQFYIHFNMTLLNTLGFLRTGLIALALINMLLRPTPGTTAAREGIEIISTLVAPAAAPILMMVILFDALMSKVRSSESSGEEKTRFQRIMLTELATVVIMIIAWLPYFLALAG